MKIVAFDIETGPLSEERIRKIAPAFKESGVKTGNLGLEKQLEKIALEKTKHISNIVSSAALNAEYGEVLAIGILGDDIPTILTGDESDILAKFWDMALKDFQHGVTTWAGHNVLGFDLPFLLRRSVIVGVSVPSFLRPKLGGRYWPDFWLDTMEVWKAGDYRATISLDRFCKASGLEGKNGSGEFFGKLFKEDKLQAIEYLENDIKITKALADRVVACLCMN
tara:strand:- start:1549 stop:2217 length:669 start_codon:yes stop_codon:yes gene_type:complete